MKFKILLWQVYSGSSGDTDPPLSIAPPLRPSNTCTDHRTGAFPNLLKLVSPGKLFHATSAITAACSYTPKLKEEPQEEHLIAMSYQFPVLSIHKVKLLQKPPHRAAIVLSQGWDTKCSFMCTANKQPRASDQHPGSFWVFCKQFVGRWHFNKLHQFPKAFLAQTT